MQSPRERVTQRRSLSLFPHCFQGAACHRWEKTKSSYFSPDPIQLATSLCVERGRRSLQSCTLVPAHPRHVLAPAAMGKGTAAISVWKLRTLFSTNNFSFAPRKSSEFNERSPQSVSQTSSLLTLQCIRQIRHNAQCGKCIYYCFIFFFLLLYFTAENTVCLIMGKKDQPNRWKKKYFCLTLQVCGLKKKKS